ncbi:binding protein [Rutstroemia sp. NJR-2017a WRK4]|nr:binding protein [Rutstroemia sp. NJR-2017a WRK4]
MFSKTLIATLLASTAVATPIAARTSNNAFKLISFAFGPNSPLQGLDIVAYNGGLWIGKNTTSYCPEGIDCPAGTETSFVYSDNKNVALNVVVPGGQQLYIGTDYAVSYTVAHSADVHGGKAQGWEYLAPGVDANGPVGLLTYPNYGFLACASPEGPGIYSIAATPGGEGTGNCTAIQLGALEYKGDATAWQYQN